LNKAGHIRFVGNSEDLFEQLRQFGFTPSYTWLFAVRDLTGGRLKQIFDVGNWHFNGLWTEGYSM
jgi:hypothetical protein